MKNHFLIISIAVLFFTLPCKCFAAFELQGKMLDTRIIDYKVPNISSSAHSASQGNRALVVWNGAPSVELQYDIYGRFINADGQPIDSTILHICTSSGAQWNPKVAYGDGKYCVIWEDQRNGDTRPDLYFTILDTLGNITDSIGKPLVITKEQFDADIDFCDSCFLAVWRDDRNDATLGDIYGARISINGSVLDNNGFAICQQPNWQEGPVVATNGYNFIVAWNDARDGDFKIYYSLVTPGGDTLGGEGWRLSLLNERASDPSVSSDGTDYLVAWSDSNYNRIVTKRIDMMGTAIDSVPLIVDSGWINKSKLCYGDSLYFLYYNYSDTIRCKRIHTNNTLADIAPHVVENNISLYYSGLTFVDNHIILAYNDPKASTYLIAASVLDTNGIVAYKDKHLTWDSTYIANTQWEPVAASNGTNYLVSWWGNSNNITGRDIGAINIDGLGNAIDTSLFICSSPWNQIFQEIAYGNNNYMEIWSDDYSTFDRKIYGRMIDSYGIPMGNIFRVCAAVDTQQTGGIAFGEGNYLAVWPEAWGQRINYCLLQDSTNQGTATILDSCSITTPSGVNNPEVSWNGTNYLMAYAAKIYPYAPFADLIVCRRVNSSGVIIDSSRIEVSDKIYDTWGEIEVSSSSNNWLIVWYDSQQIYGVRVDTSGIVLDNTPILLSQTIENDGCGWPRVAFDGSNYIVTWYGGLVAVGNWCIYGVIVSPEGIILDRFYTKNHGYDQLYPGIASDGKGNVLITWQEEAPEPYRSHRVYGALFEDPQGVSGQPIEPVNNNYAINIYPNPVKSNLRIKYQLQKQSNIKITIYNICGQTIKTLIDGQRPAGTYLEEWNCKNNNGASIQSGVYFYRINIDGKNINGKIVVVR